MCDRGLFFAHRQLGHSREALEAGESSRILRKSLSLAYPDVPKYKSDWAGSIHNIGLILSPKPAKQRGT